MGDVVLVEGIVKTRTDTVVKSRGERKRESPVKWWRLLPHGHMKTHCAITSALNKYVKTPNETNQTGLPSTH